MSRIGTLLAGTALALALGAGALAQDSSRGTARVATSVPTAIFEQMDANKDGKIARAEFDAFRDSEFKAADKNGDRFISGDEFAAYSDTQRALVLDRYFARLDANKDGRLTAEELPRRGARAQRSLDFDRIEGSKNGFVTLDAYVKAADERSRAFIKQRFERYDLNRDGKLDGDELSGARRERLLRNDRDGSGTITLEEYAGFRDGRARVEAEFKAMDADGDGKLTAAEHKAAAPKPRLLLLADRDRDGKLSKEELAQSFGARGTSSRERVFARIDGDDDGKASAAEWTAAGERLFARLDRNKDGEIATDEVRSRRSGEPANDGRSRERRQDR